MHITLLGAHVPSNTSQLVTKFYANCNINSIQCTISQINKMNENLLFIKLLLSVCVSLVYSKLS